MRRTEAASVRRPLSSPIRATARRRGDYFGYAGGALKLLEHACARGADRGALIERMQLGTYVFDHPDGRLPTRCYYNLIVAAAEFLHDPWFGIRYLETAQPGDIGAVGFAVISSQTLGDAFARVARYLSYLTEAERISIIERDDVVRIEWKFLGPRHPAHPMVSEMYAYDFTALAARMTGAPIQVEAIHFRHPPRRPLNEYAALFRCRPQFKAVRDECLLKPETLHQPMPRADRAMAAFFDKFLSERARDAHTQAELLAREVLRSLCDGVPTLGQLAKCMGSSTRSLQRQLAAEGTSVRGVVDQVRHTAALEQVANNVPLADISYLLGFRDTRSFFRAFRRWTGATPIAWRSKRSRRERP